MTDLTMENRFELGRNDVYAFCIAQMGGRWVGFAEGGGMIFIFPNVSEGYTLGLPDKDKAIRLTSAIAQDIQGGYGSVTQWHIPKEQRGNPEVYRCQECLEVGCEGDCGEYNEDDLP